MRRVGRTISSQRGASIIIALVFLLICSMIAVVVVNFSGANAERSSQRIEEQQAYLNSASAVRLVQDIFDKDTDLGFTMNSADDDEDLAFSYGTMDPTSEIAIWTKFWTKTVYEAHRDGTTSSYKAANSSQTFDVVVSDGLARSDASVEVVLTMDVDYKIGIKIVKGSSTEYPYELNATISPSNSKIAYDGNGNPIYPYTVSWYEG